MPRRYFLKTVFPINVAEAIETPVSKNQIPLTRDNMTQLIKNQLDAAQEFSQEYGWGMPKVTLWVELEDGSQEEINPDDLL